MGRIRDWWLGEPETRGESVDLARPISPQFTGAAYGRLPDADSAEGTAASTATVEAVASLWSRALDSAELSGMVARYLPDDLMAQVGRDIVLEGQSVWWIDPDGPRLIRVVDAQVVAGDPDPDTWIWQGQLPSPSGESVLLEQLHGSVLWFRWGTVSGLPWIAEGPLTAARLTARLLWTGERRLADINAGPFGQMLAMGTGSDPGAHGRAAQSSQVADALAKVRADIVPWTTHNIQGQDVRPVSLGSMIDESLPAVVEDARHAVAAACGVPASLLSNVGSSSTLREVWRVFLSSSVSAKIEMVGREIGEKLGTVDITIPALTQSDISGRTRSLKQLVEAGVSLDVAGRLTGLDVTQGAA